MRFASGEEDFGCAFSENGGHNGVFGGGDAHFWHDYFGADEVFCFEVKACLGIDGFAAEFFEGFGVGGNRAFTENAAAGESHFYFTNAGEQSANNED